MRANVKAEYKKEWALIGETGWRANNVKKQLMVMEVEGD